MGWSSFPNLFRRFAPKIELPKRLHPLSGIRRANLAVENPAQEPCRCAGNAETGPASRRGASRHAGVNYAREGGCTCERVSSAFPPYWLRLFALAQGVAFSRLGLRQSLFLQNLTRALGAAADGCYWRKVCGFNSHACSLLVDQWRLCEGCNGRAVGSLSRYG